MKKHYVVIALASFFIFAFISCKESPKEDSLQADSTKESPVADSKSGPLRAAEGDSVWVFVNHIKADKREQFERFVHEIFWDSASRLSEPEQLVFRQTRVLHPNQPEKDGTYSYIFIMDPVIPGGDYSIESLTKKIYGDQKAKEYLAMLEETNAREQTGYIMVQSRH